MISSNNFLKKKKKEKEKKKEPRAGESVEGETARYKWIRGLGAA